MAKKYRYIQTDIWNESWFAELSPKAKLVYLHLLTNPSTNNSGVYIKREKAIAFECGLDDVGKYLKELQDRGEVVLYEDYVVVLRHPEFQKWTTSASIAQAIISDLESTPNEVIELLRTSKFRYKPIKNEQSFIKEKERVKREFDQREQRKKTHKMKNSSSELETKKSVKGDTIFDEEIPFGYKSG